MTGLRLLLVLFVAVVVCGCRSVTFAQPKSDVAPPSIPEGHGVVVFEATGEERAVAVTNSGRLLVAFARVREGDEYKTIVEEGKWDFATYPCGSDSKYPGIASFRVGAGEVLNVGKLHVVRIRRHGEASKYVVSVEENRTAATGYLERVAPALVSTLNQRPIAFLE